MLSLCHCWKYFVLIIISEVGKTYQQIRRKHRAEVFLSVTIFRKHFNMVSKVMRYKSARVVFNFPPPLPPPRPPLHNVVSNCKHRVQSILCIKTSKALVIWVAKQIFKKYFPSYTMFHKSFSFTNCVR